ncbi:MAG: hypothetical protein LBK83_16035 [Treponema sp.]|nr:hypothetical protein [Treponema sp.]
MKPGLKIIPDTNRSFRLMFFSAFFFSGAFLLFAQSEVRQIPKTVYVGDRAILAALPVSAESLSTELLPRMAGAPIALPEWEGLPLKLHALRMEKHGESWELRLEFSAYAAGRIEIPDFDLKRSGESLLFASSGSGEIPFRNLSVDIASLLKGNDAILSGPAETMTMPGTFLLVYGAIAVLVLFALSLLALKLWGRQAFSDFLRYWKRRRLCGAMIRIARRTEREIGSREGEDRYRTSLSALSAEFRSWLAYLSGLDCRAMAAAEFLSLKLLHREEEVPPVLEGRSLSSLFDRWETLSYGVLPPGREEALVIANEVLETALALDRAERGRW